MRIRMGLLQVLVVCGLAVPPGIPAVAASFASSLSSGASGASGASDSPSALQAQGAGHVR